MALEGMELEGIDGLIESGVLGLSVNDPTADTHTFSLVLQTTSKKIFVKQENNAYEELSVMGTGIAIGNVFALKGSDPIQGTDTALVVYDAKDNSFYTKQTDGSYEELVITTSGNENMIDGIRLFDNADQTLDVDLDIVAEEETIQTPLWQTVDVGTWRTDGTNRLNLHDFVTGSEPITITDITLPSIGFLDPELTFAEGVISGNPRNGRDYNLTFRATNSAGSTDTTFHFPIQAVGTIRSDNPIIVNYPRGMPHSVDLGQFFENVDRVEHISGTLPPNIGFSDNGLIFGTLSDDEDIAPDGTTTIGLRLLNDAGQTLDVDLNVVVGGPVWDFRGIPFFSFDVNSNVGLSPLNLEEYVDSDEEITSITAVGLPPGLSIVESYGRFIIIGTPTVIGVYNPTFTAVSSAGTASASMTFRIVSIPVWSSIPFQIISVGGSINLDLNDYVQNDDPVEFRLDFGDSLPPGISLSLEGILSGSNLTSAGSYQFNIRASSIYSGTGANSPTIGITIQSSTDPDPPDPPPSATASLVISSGSSSSGSSVIIQVQISIGSMSGTVTSVSHNIPGVTSVGNELVGTLGPPGTYSVTVTGQVGSQIVTASTSFTIT